MAVVGDAKSHREARIHPLITAVSIALFWRWLGFFSVDRLQTTQWFVWLVYAVPIVPSVISIWFIARGQHPGTPDLLGRAVGGGWSASRRCSQAPVAPTARPHGDSREACLMGWTLSRYFFVRYATITIWFFIGMSALILLVDFTELAGRVAGLPGFTLAIALGISALEHR